VNVIYDVAITNGAFEPASMTLKVGDAVMFTNRDINPHTITPAGAIYDVALLSPGQQCIVNFREAGSFPYFCRITQGHKGMITVMP
jgi:plastocyanin